MSEEDKRSSEKGSCCGPRCCGIAGTIGAIIFAVIAIILPFIVSDILDKQLRLVPGTVMYDFWEESPVPMYIRFYMFNVTNSHDVINSNAKPVVKQLGPYTFEEVHHRANVMRHNENFTISFQQNKTWFYKEDMSEGSLSDIITNVNVPLLSATYSIRFQPKWVKFFFNKALEFIKPPSEVFISKNVSELLFEGYSDPLLDLASHLPPGIDLPIPDYDKFGWFYSRNNSATYEGNFSIFTGEDDISKLDMMDTWNYSNQTNFYESYCGMVNGSFGEGWPPYQERSSISMYSTDLCRSITLEYTKDVKSDNGLTFYRYEGTENMFASYVENPDNWCFSCVGEYCNANSGALNSSTCRFGSPAFVSFPHYYRADSFYQNQVEGLNPDPELHRFHVDLEPRTSVPLRVSARFQINIQMQPIEGIDVVKNLTEVYVPVMWFEVTADLSPKLLKAIKFTLQGPLLGSICFFVAFFGCMVSVGVSAVIFVRRRKQNRFKISSNDQLVDGDKNDQPPVIPVINQGYQPDDH